MSLKDFILVLIFCIGLSTVDGDDIHNQLDAILTKGMADGLFPGAVAFVGSATSSTPLYTGNVGRFTNDSTSPLMTVEGSDATIFDLASVSKVFGTTSAVAWLYENGFLSLDTRVSDVLGAEYNANGKENVTVLNCLLHNAGYAPDPVPWYWSTDFGCPNTMSQKYPDEDFSCLAQVFPSLLSETLVTPPGETMVYSDLSFITLQFVAGKTALQNKVVSTKDFRPFCFEDYSTTEEGAPTSTEDFFNSITSRGGTNHKSTRIGLEARYYSCGFEALVRTKVFDKVGLSSKSGYRPSDTLKEECAPTIDDDLYTHKRLQGQVSDGNAYAMGGIAGHAGLFSIAADLATFMRSLTAPLYTPPTTPTNPTTPTTPTTTTIPTTPATTGRTTDYTTEAPSFVNATTIRLFTTAYNLTQSSRALGWDTNSYTVADFGYHNSCGSFPEEAFMHIGYTGISVCADPRPATQGGSGLYTVIMTNRVYECTGQNCPSTMGIEVEGVYTEFNSKVMELFGASSANQ
jgi:CubicO group peptidase (beta-lactamase class C family)